MADHVTERNGVPVLVCGDEGPPIDSEQDALDLIGSTYYSRAEVIAVPVGRFGPRFFTLRTGLAGEIMQKFVNYQIRLVIVGDISAQIAASTALRDLVVESNQGKHVWFVPNLDELDTRLG
jgi:hypothetical protein